MVEIAVCDDEKNIRSYLSALIRKQGSACEITEYASGADYLSGKKEFDIVFLDIELNTISHGMDGMELARRIRGMELNRQPVIIFVTGYEKYVYDAFDVDAFQYLVKPIDERKFAEVFGRAVQALNGRDGVLPGKRISEGKLLSVQCAGSNRLIPLENIRYMESRSHKVVLHLKEGELEYYAKIGDLETELQGQFFRIHKGYLINLSWVEEYNKTEVGLTGGEKLPISKYKYGDFVKAYLRFMQLCHK